MQALRFVKGKIISGHFIFVRDRGTLSDLHFLSLLGLEGYTEDRAASFPFRFAHILRGGEWSGLADDWYYSLYNQGLVKTRVEQLAQSFEILRTVVGDADNSVEFYHFMEGRLRRGFELDDWGPKSRGILLDHGPPFTCEIGADPKRDPDEFVRRIHAEVGIDSQAMASSVVTYSKPYDMMRTS